MHQSNIGFEKVLGRFGGLQMFSCCQEHQSGTNGGSSADGKPSAFSLSSVLLSFG